MPRLVRKAPLTERIKAYLDPYDVLLRILEELNDDLYDELLNAWVTPLGIGLNLVFILARGASRPSSATAQDDVFGNPEGGGWFSWVITCLVQALTFVSCANALYTFLRRRHYRLFEHSIDSMPATTSARRVRVDSTPAPASPLRFFQHVLSQATKRSRAHPDPERDVWELRVWDPKPFNLKLFTLFSPGHILLYLSILPTAALDPRPSVTVLTSILFGILLSLQLSLLRSSFTQQAKDTAVIQGEVMNEYNTKFVHPSLNHPVRDVGTQTLEGGSLSRKSRTREVDVYTPTTIINRGFKTHPNPNYADLYDPDRHFARESYTEYQPASRTKPSDPSFSTPYSSYRNAQTQAEYASSVAGGTDFSSPLKLHHERSEELLDARRGGSRVLNSHNDAGHYARASTGNSYAGSDRSGRNERTSGVIARSRRD